jgi:hypothetical protein
MASKTSSKTSWRATLDGRADWAIARKLTQIRAPTGLYFYSLNFACFGQLRCAMHGSANPRSVPVVFKSCPDAHPPERLMAYG